jgi:hypothetical protein
MAVKKKKKGIFTVDTNFTELFNDRNAKNDLTSLKEANGPNGEILRYVRYCLGEPILTVELDNEQIIVCNTSAKDMFDLLLPGCTDEEFKNKWVRKYTLALSRECLGFIRNKYDTVALPNGTVTLNGQQLIDSSLYERDVLHQIIRDIKDSLHS